MEKKTKDHTYDTLTKTSKSTIFKLIAAIFIFSSSYCFAGTGWNGIIINKSSAPLAYEMTSSGCWYPNLIPNKRTGIAPNSAVGIYTEVKNSGLCNSTFEKDHFIEFYIQSPNKQFVFTFTNNQGSSSISTRDGKTVSTNKDAGPMDGKVSFKIIIEEDMTVTYSIDSGESACSDWKYYTCIWACAGGGGKAPPKSSVAPCDQNCKEAYGCQ